MWGYKGEERRKDVRIGDKINKVAVWVASTLITLFLGIIVQILYVVVDNQISIINQGDVQIERQDQREKRSQELHSRHELKLESLGHNYNNLDKRVYKLENYGN